MNRSTVSKHSKTSLSAPKTHTPPPDWQVVADLGSLYTVRMSAEAWCKLNPHPRHRNPREHAKKIVAYARNARGVEAERLRSVSAGDLDGEIFKVDGHARGFLWETEQLPIPSEVFVQVYRVSTRSELNALYATFDTPDAAEKTIDRVKGAFYEQGLKLRSKRLKNGSIVAALHLAATGVTPTAEGCSLDLYDAVGMFRNELKLLDGLEPDSDSFSTGLVGAALIKFALSPTEALGFFKRLTAGDGRQRDGLDDPVESILRKAQTLRQSKTTRERVLHIELCGATLLAADRYLAGPKEPSYWGMTFPPAPRLTQHVSKCVNEMRAQKGLGSIQTEVAG